MDPEREKTILRRNDHQYVYKQITMDINLITEGDKQAKKEAAERLYIFIVKEKPELNDVFLQEILISFNKQLIKIGLFDPLEKCRDFCIKILIYLYSNSTNITVFFPFIFSALVDKLDCHDLEGDNFLPDEVKDRPSQKPLRIGKLTENSEEVRVLYVKLMETIIQKDYQIDSISIFVQDIVNIARTLCMDPCTAVILEACSFVKLICVKFTKLFLHFNPIIARGLLNALAHKHSKVRIAALESLEATFLCSPFKKNVEIMEALIGFRDPNLVPIKDFYEPSYKVNYFAQLIQDHSVLVRKKFLDFASNILIHGEDRFDHEARFSPYVLSGLYDEDDETAIYANQKLEDIGKQFEKDNEKDIREDIQFGVDAPWIKYCKSDAVYPFSVGSRPRLGSRLIIKKYVRRYVKALCKEYEAIEESIRSRVSNLMMYSIIFVEDSITEYLDNVFLSFERELVKPKNVGISDIIHKALTYIGRFCDYESITNLLFPTIRGDMNANYYDVQRGALICLKHIMKGHISSLKNGVGFGIFNGKLGEVFGLISNASFMDHLDSNSALELIDFYSVILNEMVLQKDQIINFEELFQYTDVLYTHITNCFSAIAIFDIQGVSDNNIMLDIEKKLEVINKNVNILTQYINNDSNVQGNVKALTLGSFNSLDNDKNKVVMGGINGHEEIVDTSSRTLSQQSGIAEKKLVSSTMISSTALVNILPSLNEPTTNTNLYSFFSSKTKETLKEVHANFKNSYLNLNSKQYKVFYVIVKSKLFGVREDPETISLIYAIFGVIFSKTENIQVHPDAIKLLVSYLNTLTEPQIIFQKQNLPNLSLLIKHVYAPYAGVENEKFKFADMLKDEKELEKKRLKAPRALKTEMKEKITVFLKLQLTKQAYFNFEKNTDEEERKHICNIFGHFLEVFDNSYLEAISTEQEKSRLSLIEVYYLFVEKFFRFSQFEFKNCPRDQMAVFKKLLLDIENHFITEIYDSNVEVRKMTLSLFTFVLQALPVGEYYAPLASKYQEMKNKSESEMFLIEALQYADQELTTNKQYFANFLKVYSILTTLYIDDKVNLGSLTEQCLKQCLYKFPMICVNEYIKCKMESRLSRVEALDKILKKYLKPLTK